MQRINSVIAFGLMTLLLHSAAIGFQQQPLVQEQQRNLEKLLKKLRRSLDLTDEAIANLDGLLKEDVVAAALEVEKNRKSLRVWSNLEGTTRNLETAMLVKAARVISDERALALNEFDHSQRSLWKLDDQHSQTAVLVFLDRHLCLSEKQMATLGTSLMENWEPFWNDHVHNLMGFNGYVSALPILDLFDQEQMEAILSEKQMAVLSSISQFVPGTELVGRGAESFASQWKAEEFRELCRQLFELKVEEYGRLVDLSPESEKLLRFGGKAAIGNVVESRKNAMEALAEDYNAFNLPMVQASLKMAVLPQCLAQDAFLKASRKALSDEQYTKIRDREMSRTKTESRYLLKYLWFRRIAPVTGMSFTYDEMTGLLQVLDDAIESDGENQYQEINAKWLSTPDEEFRSILTEDNWKRFKANLESNRRAIIRDRK